jgi:hypothetical protein
LHSRLKMLFSSSSLSAISAILALFLHTDAVLAEFAFRWRSSR